MKDRLASVIAVVIVFSVLAWFILSSSRGRHGAANMPREAVKGSGLLEQAVLVHLKLSNAKFGSEQDLARIYSLEDALEAKINEAGVGSFDGNEIGGGECVLFMYGPDADALFEAVGPTLRSSPFAKGGSVVKRYGQVDDPEAREVTIRL